MRSKKSIECWIGRTRWLSCHPRVGLGERAAARADDRFQRNPALIDKVIDEEYRTAVRVDVLVGILGRGHEVEARRTTTSAVQPLIDTRSLPGIVVAAGVQEGPQQVRQPFSGGCAGIPSIAGK